MEGCVKKRVKIYNLEIIFWVSQGRGWNGGPFPSSVPLVYLPGNEHALVAPLSL